MLMGASPIFCPTSSAGQTSRDSNGKTYFITIQKNAGHRLGVELEHDETGAALRVLRIRPGNLVDLWNRAAPADRVVWLGDLIISANGVEGAANLVDAELARDQNLRLLIFRPHTEKPTRPEMRCPRPVETFDPRCRESTRQQQSEQDDDMVYVACSVAGVPTEILVDTGAQMSVISAPLVRQLGLWDHLDQSARGVAAGVGRAAILGRLHDIPVHLGGEHGVDFELDLSVLGVKEEMLMLGLDQLRKWRVLVDLEQRRLIFNGKGGAIVSFLPPDPYRRYRRGSDCLIQ